MGGKKRLLKAQRENKEEGGGGPGGGGRNFLARNALLRQSDPPQGSSRDMSINFQILSRTFHIDLERLYTWKVEVAVRLGIKS